MAAAKERGLDLVEVSPQASPPVCKIMDYGRYKYQAKKKLHEAKKKQTIIRIKEVKLGISTDEHDLNYKLQHARRFLEEGNKVKFTVVFRGGEIVHPELGRKMIDRVISELGERAIVEQPPTQEKRFLTMVVMPKRGGSKTVQAEEGKDAKDKNTQGSSEKVQGNSQG